MEEVLIETAKRISELECLVDQAASDKERTSLLIAIAELKQVIQAHACGPMRVH